MSSAIGTGAIFCIPCRTAAPKSVASSTPHQDASEQPEVQRWRQTGSESGNRSEVEHRSGGDWHLLPLGSGVCPSRAVGGGVARGYLSPRTLASRQLRCPRPPVPACRSESEPGPGDRGLERGPCFVFATQLAMSLLFLRTSAGRGVLAKAWWRAVRGQQQSNRAPVRLLVCRVSVVHRLAAPGCWWWCLCVLGRHRVAAEEAI